MESISAQIKDFCTIQSRKFTLYRIALIVIVGISAYSNTLFSPFIFDDAANILHNPVIMDISLAGFKSAFCSRRAIGVISFQLNYLISGWNVYGYHITNIMIHLLASLSVYRLLQLIMNSQYMVENSDDSFRRVPIPFFAALLFVAHPVQTQAVTYIVQRFASMATLFYLAAIIAYLTARNNQVDLGRKVTLRSVVWFSAALLFGWLAVYTKETAYTLPLAIILVEMLFFKSSRGKTFLVTTSAATAVIAIMVKYATSAQSVQNAISALDEATRLQTITTRSDYLLTQFRVIMTYIRLLVLPVNQRLDYDIALSHSLTDWRVLCSFLAIVSLLFAACRMLMLSRKGSPYLRLMGFGVFWFFLTLSIESTIIPIIDLIFEHRLYLPMFGAVTALSAAAMMLTQRKEELSGKGVCIGFLLVSIILAVTAYNRNSVWSSEVSIWADSVKKSPQSARAWNNLGAVYIKQKEPVNALHAIIRSIELDPSKPDAWNNLGIAIDIIGAYNDRFNRTTEMFDNPGSFENKIVNKWLGDVNNNLGLAYEITGNLEKAAENYSNAVGYNPSLGVAYYNLGIASAKIGDQSRYSSQVQILRMIDPLLAERLQSRIEKR